MLEPTDFPDGFRELEEELSRPPTADLSQEFRARVMESVRQNLQRTRVLPSSRTWVSLSAVSVAAAAAVILIVALFDSHRVTPTKPKNIVEVPTVIEAVTSSDESPSQPLPTLQRYRLAISESPANWEGVLHRETDLFEELNGESRAFRWRQNTSSLPDQFD